MKLDMNASFVKRTRRFMHQINRLDRCWDCIQQDDKPEKGQRMRRVLEMKGYRHMFLANMLIVMMESHHEA